MDGPAALVVTTINPPTAAMQAIAAEANERGIEVFAIGDRKGPDAFALPGVTFRSYDQQLTSDFEYPTACPPGHYARKNVGYLEAVAVGARVIVETDDDNFPRPAFFGRRARQSEGEVFRGAGWVNVYGLFSDTGVWPRGFPLQLVRSPVPASSGTAAVACPVQNGLADDDPDVDAMYRMVGDLPVTFAERLPVILLAGSWCPFNSQNTTFFPEAYPLAYLPRHCTFRMTDIWRSLVAQRVLGENGWGLLFHGASVWQERNEHDLLVDFADEIPGYLHNAAIVDRFSALDLPRGEANIFEAMRVCYEDLVRNQLVGREELKLLEAFERDLIGAGWKPGIL